MKKDCIEVRGARAHNLKNIDVDIPLGKIVGIAGVSGSGKSSLALGVLYAEGSRRYLESLSTYTRRRMTQAARAQVDDVRYVPAALAPRLRGISLAVACQMTLSELIDWVDGVPASLPEPMLPMAERICESFQDTAKRLVDLGLSYLSLDRAASTLSTGERQRVQLARSVRNRTTGVLYVLDEPSIGLHPSNLEGLTGVMDDLVADGNSVVLVDHDTQVLAHADWIIELGPEAGAKGGRIVASGTPAEIAANPDSVTGRYL